MGANSSGNALCEERPNTGSSGQRLRARNRGGFQEVAR
jgi:hypothetical protein